jgi:hypothetical protein
MPFRRLSGRYGQRNGTNESTFRCVVTSLCEAFVQRKVAEKFGCLVEAPRSEGRESKAKNLVPFMFVALWQELQNP